MANHFHFCVAAVAKDLISSVCIFLKKYAGAVSVLKIGLAIPERKRSHTSQLFHSPVTEL